MKKIKNVLILASIVSVSAKASLIGVMDSGTDITHLELAPKVWKNAKELPGNKDLDGDGLPGDVNGFDFTTMTPITFDPKYVQLIDNDVKTFFNYYSKYDLGTVNSQELGWLKLHAEDQKLMNTVDFIGGYIHGTHVAGISAKMNPNAKILTFKIIPTVYNPLPINPTPVGAPNNKEIQKPLPPAPPVTPAMMAQFRNELSKQAVQQVEQMVQIHKVLNFQKVDVVNQSFGIGWNDSAKFIASAFYQAFKRLPTQLELTSLQKSYFDKLISDGIRMFDAAPKTIFCIAAGNDASDNDANPDYPSSIKAENRIVVAATLGYSSLAKFSNFGATRVDVAAPGVAILSTAPGQNYIPLSGTSQATPFVTNTIAKMKDINPKLSVADIRQIVFGTVDKKPWLAGKVVTSGIVNMDRAVKAAELAITNSVQVSITKALTLVPDVAVVKSLATDDLDLPEIGFKFKRPSLLIVE